MGTDERRKGMIKGYLSKDKAEEIFKDNSLYLSQGNVVPCYRITELFGEWANRFMKYGLKNGGDCNAWGDCSSERPVIHFLYKSGFMKVVAESNYILMMEEIKEKGISGELNA